MILSKNISYILIILSFPLQFVFHNLFWSYGAPLIESNWNLNPNLVAEMFGIDLNIFYHVVHVHDSMRVTIGHKFSCKYYFKNLSLQKVSET